MIKILCVIVIVSLGYVVYPLATQEKIATSEKTLCYNNVLQEKCGDSLECWDKNKELLAICDSEYSYIDESENKKICLEQLDLFCSDKENIKIFKEEKRLDKNYKLTSPICFNLGYSFCLGNNHHFDENLFIDHLNDYTEN